MTDVFYVDPPLGPELPPDVQRVADAIMEAHSQWEQENNRDRPGLQYPWTRPHLGLLARAAMLAMKGDPP